MAETNLLRLVCLLFLVLSAMVLREDVPEPTPLVEVLRVLAWIILIKCIAFCWWTDQVARLSSWFFEGPLGLVRIMGACASAVGVWLLYISPHF